MHVSVLLRTRNQIDMTNMNIKRCSLVSVSDAFPVWSCHILATNVRRLRNAVVVGHAQFKWDGFVLCCINIILKTIGGTHLHTKHMWDKLLLVQA